MKKISGHICQGHIDCTGILILNKKIDKSYLFEFVVNKNVRMNLVEKASISINGVSLTISKKTKKGFQTWIIPQTLKLRYQYSQYVLDKYDLIFFPQISKVILNLYYHLI